MEITHAPAELSAPLETKLHPRVYFKNLNGFRFLAASGVIITHIELYKSRMGSPNIWKHPLVFELGSAAVDFFFVLSGFLITYLLLEEKKQFAKINFRMFYLRRILRIWPVYFLVILAAFFFIPYIPIFYTPGYSEDLWVNHIAKLVSCLLIFPNVALEVFGNIPYASPAWSIGVEEQFYIIWPFLIAGSKNLVRSILIFIALFISFKVGLFFVSPCRNIFARNIHPDQRPGSGHEDGMHGYRRPWRLASFFKFEVFEIPEQGLGIIVDPGRFRRVV